MIDRITEQPFCQTSVSGSTFVNADCFDVFPFIEDKSIESQEFGAVKVKNCMIDFEGTLEEGVELISQDYIFKDIELVGGELSGVNSENIDEIINKNV